MKAIAIVALLMIAAPASLRAEDSLPEAKELYANAAYEDALSMLTRMNESGPGPAATLREIDEYRAFCLYALGRTNEAEQIAESIVRSAPLTALDAEDASPRIQTLFEGVRRRLLPSLIRERFRTARAGLDQKNYAEAEPPLREARLMLADAEELSIEDSGLADLRVLVDGFLELMESRSEQERALHTAARPAVDTAPSGPPVAQPGSRPGPQVYSVTDQGVTVPSIINQRMPPLSPEMVNVLKGVHRSGILHVVIDETGEVVEALVRESLHPAFDEQVVRAARRWKYVPAMKDGVPVRFVKTIALVVP